MNIGIVTTWFERGAAYVSKAYQKTLNKEHRVFIYARGGEYSAKNDVNWDNKTVTWNNKKYKSNKTDINFSYFRKWIKNNNIEMVLFNEQNDWGIIHDCKKLDIKTVAYIDYYTQKTVPLFDLYDSVICNTKRHYSVFERHFQAFYIPWGTDLSIFKPANGRKKIGDKITFFHSAGMGGTNLRKGTDILIRVFHKTFGRQNNYAELIIHSQVALDNYGKEIISIIQESQNIKFLHKTVSAPGLYHLGDVYVYPTRLEGIGLSIIEALACGLPVITTNNAPMNEFVKEDVNGKLVNIKQYLGRPDGYYWAESVCCEDSLKKALKYFVENKNLILTLQNETRKYAETFLDWGKNSVALNDIVKNIVTNPQKKIIYDNLSNCILDHTDRLLLRLKREFLAMRKMHVKI